MRAYGQRFKREYCKDQYRPFDLHITNTDLVSFITMFSASLKSVSVGCSVFIKRIAIIQTRHRQAAMFVNKKSNYLPFLV